jgi:hypothetical protein
MMDSHHEARVAEANAFQEREKEKREKKKHAPKKETYVLKNNKILKITISASGAKFSEYIGKPKQCPDIMKKYNLG